MITLNEAKEGGRRPGNGGEGREGGDNEGPGANSTWEWREGAARKSSTALRQTEGGQLAGDILPALPHHRPGRVTAAPRSVARQTLPRHRSAAPVFATSPFCRATIHDAAQTFRRAMTIGAAKNVSLKKNKVRFKISLQKVLKLKKKT